MFDLAAPIMAAPIAGESDARLAAAVSNAGGLGTFGAMHPAQPDEWVAEQLQLARGATDRAFGVGFITDFIRFVPQRFEAVLDDAPSVIALSFGDPRLFIERAHAAGAKVICQVQTLGHARLAVDAGADVLAAQGTEAGGHTGTMGLLPLLGSVLDACPDVPVLAAGGVASGRTLAAVLAMGADGAWIGSAFLATDEAPGDHSRVKDLIVASDGSDTVWTRSYDIVSGLPWPDGIGERVRANAFTARWEGREAELRATRDEVEDPRATSDPDESPVLYGQSAAFVRSVRPAAAVIDEITGDAARLLAARRS
jgi:nitronate monooxygenase